MNDIQSNMSLARAYELGPFEVADIADAIVKAYNDKQDKADGSSMFPGELRNLIIDTLNED